MDKGSSVRAVKSNALRKSAFVHFYNKSTNRQCSTESTNRQCPSDTANIRSCGLGFVKLFCHPSFCLAMLLFPLGDAGVVTSSFPTALTHRHAISDGHIGKKVKEGLHNMLQL